MKVVAFNGSPREDGNTFQSTRIVLDTLEAAGIDTELVQLGGQPIRGCLACYKCAKNKNRRCSVKHDMVNDCIEKMLASDGIILASPTYFSNVSTEIKALIDRAGIVAKVNGDMLRRKVGAAVIAVRRAGSVQAFAAINQFFLINQMIIPGANYWNLAIGHDKGDVAWDQEGQATLKVLGENTAWLLKRVRG